LQTYNDIISPLQNVDEYEAFYNFINLLTVSNLEILQDWEVTLSNEDKEKFKNLMKIRRININKIISDDTNTLTDNSILQSLSLGTVPRKIVSIKRNAELKK